MHHLPPVTAPPGELVQRRHAPNKAAYDTYQSCLRWDFGFTCAFCLLHEADLDSRGCIGTALLTIEHFEPRAQRADRVDDYHNCLLACRMCNTVGGNHKNARGGAVLLDPTAVAWSAHFVVRDDQLVPIDGDRDAEYTARTYGINRAFQRVRRQGRRVAVEEAMYTIQHLPLLLDDLNARATRYIQQRRGTEARLLLRSIAVLECTLTKAREQLRRYAPIPTDRPEQCRCAVQNAMSLPRWLTMQLVPIG